MIKIRKGVLKNAARIIVFGFACLVLVVVFTWSHWWWRIPSASVLVDGHQRSDCMVFHNGGRVMIAINFNSPGVPPSYGCIVVDPTRKISFTTDASDGFSLRGPEIYVFHLFSLVLPPLSYLKEQQEENGPPPECNGHTPEVKITQRDLQYTDTCVGQQIDVKNFR